MIFIFVFFMLSFLLLRCLGYTDLGAREGRAELVRRAKLFCKKSAIPLLTFPEGAMTSGCSGLLKFSTWPFEVLFVQLYYECI